jgi:peroxiredoxin
MATPVPARAAARSSKLPLAVVAGAILTLTLVLYFDLLQARPSPEVLVTRNFGAQVVNRPAPDFEVIRQDGSRVRLSSLRGKVVFVNFWATWCPPCRDEMPDLEKLTASMSKVPFELVAVSADESWQEINAFLAGNPTQMLIGLDPEKSISHAWGTEKFPESFVVDRRGQVRLRFVNVQPWTDERIQRYLEWLALND